MPKTMLSEWVNAFRLRTSPLAFSSIILGNTLLHDPDYRWDIALLALVTTLLLQVLSNLANDYGDGVKGTDNSTRIGPERALQRGIITPTAMLNMMFIVGILALASGITLVLAAFPTIGLSTWLFLGLGIGSIAASVKYTVGKSAYGYRGLGDLFVFIFFGLVGVLGTFYLHHHQLQEALILPAVAVGLLSVGVLNLNNMRDRETDAKSGKITVAVRLGKQRSLIYHDVLLIAPLVCCLAYGLLVEPGALLAFLTAPLIIAQLIQTHRAKTPQDLDPMLKKLALTTFLFSLLFGFGTFI